jgi:hypothetical protein
MVSTLGFLYAAVWLTGVTGIPGICRGMLLSTGGVGILTFHGFESTLSSVLTEKTDFVLLAALLMKSVLVLFSTGMGADMMGRLSEKEEPDTLGELGFLFRLVYITHARVSRMPMTKPGSSPARKTVGGNGLWVAFGSDCEESRLDESVAEAAEEVAELVELADSFEPSTTAPLSELLSSMI